MRILIISDTHRKLDNLEEVMEKVKPDKIFHLGDAEGDEDIIQAEAGCPLEIVRGNCDFYSNLPAELVLEVGNHIVFMTHGHYYDANYGVDDLVVAAQDKDADVVMYGHTHVPLIEEYDGVTVINPGSISNPRQEGRKPSYIVLDVDSEGELHFNLNYIERHSFF